MSKETKFVKVEEHLYLLNHLEEECQKILLEFIAIKDVFKAYDHETSSDRLVFDQSEEILEELIETYNERIIKLLDKLLAFREHFYKS